MEPDASAIAQREKLYRKFWRRRITGKYRSGGSEGPRVNVYAFLPTWNPWAPARAYIVYVTGGLSDAPMPGAQPSRVELTAYAKYVAGFADPNRDIIAKWLHAFAQIPFSENLPIRPGETFDAGQHLAPDSEMSAFFFAETPLVNQDALRRATLHADAVLHVVPISEAERALAEREGSAALAAALQRAGVRLLFDLGRRSCV